MAYRLASQLENAKSIQATATVANKTKGLVEVIGGVLGFWLTDVTLGELGTFIIGGQIFEVDCDNTIAYTAGDAIYDDGVAPTGTVNKTSGGTRVVVGYAAKSYSIGATKIEIVPVR